MILLYPIDCCNLNYIDTSNLFRNRNESFIDNKQFSDETIMLYSKQREIPQAFRESFYKQNCTIPNIQTHLYDTDYNNFRRDNSFWICAMSAQTISIRKEKKSGRK